MGGVATVLASDVATETDVTDFDISGASGAFLSGLVAFKVSAGSSAIDSSVFSLGSIICLILFDQSVGWRNFNNICSALLGARWNAINPSSVATWILGFNLSYFVLFNSCMAVAILNGLRKDTPSGCPSANQKNPQMI
jgi:hypothetical protein